MLVALSVGQLDKAEAVAPWNESHRFSVDCDWSVGETHIRRQVFLVQINGHSNSSRASNSAL
jgi:hypothetical protein